MKVWLVALVVNSAIVSAAAVGLSLHLRLIRYFDLVWAVWAFGGALIGVSVAAATSSPTVGLLLAAAAGASIGAVLDSRHVTASRATFIPAEALERYSFSTGVGLYVALVSIAEVTGFNGQRILPSVDTADSSVFNSSVVVAGICWTAIALLGIVRSGSHGLLLRAMATDPSVCRLYGFSMGRTAAELGAIAGALTGLAAGAYGIVYSAEPSTGMQLMLLAVTPPIVTGMRDSRAVVGVATLMVAIVSSIRWLAGEHAAQLATYALVAITVVTRPIGLRPASVRPV